MRDQYDPSREIFDPKDCAKPMVAAVEQLATDSKTPLDFFDGRSYAEIAALASDTYGEELPEFWRVWKGWHDPQPDPEMGDL